MCEIILFGVRQRRRGFYDTLNELLMMSLSKKFISLRPDKMLELSFFLCRLCVDDAEATCNHGNKERCGFFFLLVMEVKVHTANTSFFSCSLPHMKQQEMTTGSSASI